MIKKIIFATGIIFAAVTTITSVAAAAQPPDYDEILARTTDPASEFYYPALLQRYIDGDDELNGEHYRALYYGFVFHDQYKPLDPITEETEILNIFDGVGMEMTADDAAKVLELARKVMERDPFSPANINFMTFAYGILGDTENERLSALRLAGVLSAISSSGDGIGENSAWHVISFAHVNDFLGARGLEPRNRRVVSRALEYVTLREPDGKNKGYYFDFSRAYSKPPTVMPEKPKGIKMKM